MPRLYFLVIGLLVLCLLPALSIAAPLVAKVDISTQTMTVYLDGAPAYSWPVSTARKGKITPVGTFRGQALSRHHRSSLYNNAPMPYAIFSAVITRSMALIRSAVWAGLQVPDAFAFIPIMRRCCLILRVGWARKI
jgi:lipoprotein-anchoring transpeptidase ErfK/SrfK